MGIRYISILLIALLMCGCTEKIVPGFKNYKATKGDTVGLLSLSGEGSSFHGRYEVYYNESGKDSGEVKGNRIGDTLRGIYTYRSYGGNRISRPIIFLKIGDSLKLGRGAETRYLNIPHYMPGTISFNDNNLYFKPCSAEALRP